MSKALEFQGKNVDQALKAASDELSIPAAKIKHEVIAYGSSGIFGLVGVKKAKIKVFVEEKKKLSKPTKPVAVKPAGDSAEVKAVLKESSQNSHQATPKYDDGLVQNGIGALQKIVDSISTDAKVGVDKKRDKLLYTISGGESGVLIGKRGQTLEAIQYLLEKMINKKSTNRVRVLVDVEGYLEKRKNNLKQMATRMGEKAKRTKKPVTIGQMNAHDRRIVHIHLKDEKGVRTQSIGDGYYRKLMIFPKKKGASSRRKNEKKE